MHLTFIPVPLWFAIVQQTATLLCWMAIFWLFCSYRLEHLYWAVPVTMGLWAFHILHWLSEAKRIRKARLNFQRRRKPATSSPFM